MKKIDLNTIPYNIVEENLENLMSLIRYEPLAASLYILLLQYTSSFRSLSCKVHINSLSSSLKISNKQTRKAYKLLVKLGMIYSINEIEFDGLFYEFCLDLDLLRSEGLIDEKNNFIHTEI